MTQETHGDPEADALAAAAQTVTATASITAAITRLHQERAAQTDARGRGTTDVRAADVVQRSAPTRPPRRTNAPTTPALTARPVVRSSATSRRR